MEGAGVAEELRPLLEGLEEAFHGLVIGEDAA